MTSKSRLLLFAGASAVVGCAPAVPHLESAGAALIDNGADWVSTESDSSRGQAWADWDGDGDLDLAVANSSQPCRVYENTGGALTLAWSATMTLSSYDVAWGDWDGDGYPELAVANSGTGNQVYENSGGSLTLAWTSTETDASRGVAWGDLEGDGDLDLAVANHSNQANRVYVNSGGALSLGWTATELARDSWAVAWGDFDGNGYPDLAFANDDPLTGYNRVYSNSAGTLSLFWTAPNDRDSRDVAWGDIDGDGDLDLAFANHDEELGSRLYEYTGGTFTSVWFDTEDVESQAVAFGDVDRDGDLDLILGNDDEKDHLYFNNGGSFSSSKDVDFDNGTTGAVEFVDWNGDGSLELSTVGVAVANRIYENAGDMPAVTASSTNLKVRDVALGDADGDGDLDVLVVRQDEPTVVMTTDGSFTTLWTQPSSAKSQAGAWADWDGDGDLDFAVANEDAPDTLWVNDGTGTFTLGWSSSGSEKGFSIAWGDWDGDGDLDLAVGNYSQPNRIYENTGGTLALAWSSTQTDKTVGLAWVDVDGDLDLDLWAANEGEPNRLYLGNGGTSMTLSYSTTETDTSFGVAIGDVDGNGEPDVVFGNQSQPNRAYANSGGSFTLLSSTTETTKARDLCLVDFDFDGDLDMIAANKDQQNEWYSNDGAGTFTLTAVANAAEKGDRAIGCADLDGDGDIDFVSGLDNKPLQLWTNHLRGDDLLPANPTGVVLAAPTSAPLGDDLVVPTAVTGSSVTVDFTLLDAESESVPGVTLQYSDSGGGGWATATVTGETTDLATSPAGVSHSLTWDVATDGLNSDRVMLRLVLDEADPAISAPDQTEAGAAGVSPLFRAWECFPLDADGDSSPCDLDCDDADPAIYPGATEIVDDGIDQDCNGTDSVTCFVNDDGDAYGTSATLVADDGDCLDAGESSVDGDCDDTSSSVYPGAPEVVDDGIDQDCSGEDSITCFDDGDGDGYGDGTLVSDDEDCDDAGEASVDGDCDDADASTHPGATEVVDDGIDQDCSGEDSITCFDDGDGDGYGDGTLVSVDEDCTDSGEASVDGDCNDASASIYPGAAEVVGDGIDQDCNGFDTVTCYVDGDGDGWGDGAFLADDGDCTDSGEAALGGDCDDTEDTIYPGAPEIPADLIDQNCDGVDDGTSCFEDLDGDTFGSTEVIVSADEDCDDPGESDFATDCDDTAALTYPGAPEVADDDIDQDCSGADTVTCFTDSDGDDYGNGTQLAADGDCTDAGEASVGGDCDDTSSLIFPGAPEVSDDGIDQDCSGADTVTCFVDGDGDSFGSSVTILASDGDCTDAGEASVSGDCNDAAASVYPGATEISDDGVDQDCNGTDTVTCFVDSDGDSYGSAATTSEADGDCTDAGEAAVAGDCNDGDATTFPGASEVLDDGIDQDCNGSDTVTCLQDLDGDTYGSTVTVLATDGECADAGETATPGDCDDSLPSVYPGAPEACDATDSDCDGDSIDGFLDTDGDGTLDCVDSDDDNDGFEDDDDCGPLNGSIYPDAPEVCDAIDSDCDGDLVDGDLDTDGDGTPDCIEGDIDGDGFNAAVDCDDGDTSVYPGAPETPDDGIDQDCNGFDTVTCFEDLDGDTWGTAATVLGDDGDCLDAGESTIDTDCDDADPGSFPGAPEIADDGIDQNCSGDDTITCFVDADGDAFGSQSNVLSADGDCFDAGEAPTGDDCNDADNTIWPGAPEVCDAIDSDCDGDLIDGEPDTDGDGVPDCLDADSDNDLFPDAVDCEPLDATIYPLAPELCDDIDSDCDGSLVDEFDDSDGDGVPDCIDDGATDFDGDGYAADVDCDDTDATIHPDAIDLPDDDVDQDCDGIDERTCYEDGDGDGYGSDPVTASTEGLCPGGTVPLDGDCDDGDDLISPDAPELCNGVDDDCDGDVPADELTDGDGDGLVACVDCDDDDEGIGAGTPELCADGLDTDCDGAVDEGDSDCDGLVDLDGDGWCEDGIDLDGDGACDGPDEPFEGEEVGDCNDTDALVSPGAVEICDGLDQDCDPANDEDEQDLDGDGAAPCDGDCDDGDPLAGPDVEEICADGIDQDCDRTETDAHDDPECWAAACTDCSGSVGGGVGAGGSALALLLVGVLGLRRRSAVPGLIAAGLLLATGTAHAAPEPIEPIEQAIAAGDCEQAATLARVASAAAPASPALARLLGDAERCLGNARPAVLAYQRLLDLEPAAEGVSALVEGLRTSLAVVRVEIQSESPATPVARLVVDGEELPGRFDTEGAAVFLDLTPTSRVVLHVSSPGFAPVEQSIEGLLGGEVRVVQASPEWVGFGKVALGGVDCNCQVYVGDSTQPLGADPAEVTAGPNPVRLVNAHGSVAAQVEVARGETATFDPGPWRPASVRIVGLPAGASIRVFVEGPEGQAAHHEGTLDPERGTLHDRTGVRVASPHTVGSLYGGSGGVFVSHPVVGRGVTAVVLVPGEKNTVSFDWSELGGVAAVEAQYTRYKEERLEAITSHRPRTVAFAAAAIGAGVGAAILAAAAVGAGGDATGLKQQALTSSPVEVDAIHRDWETAMNAERGLLVGTGILSAVSLTSAGLTITFGLQGRKALVEVGEWTPRAPEASP